MIVDLATELALFAHHGQPNKHSGEPYILHVHRVACSVRDRGLSDTHIAVAWLHDTVEDTPLDATSLYKRFPDNPDILPNVLALTKVKGVSNEEYYERLLDFPIAAAVKVCDIHDNFRRNHLITDEDTRLRMGKKYSLGLDILKGYV